jgi:GcrA cell cycle regulator
MFAWTPAVIERMTALAADGYSSGQIAEAIGAPTRNTVVGKAQRLGIKLIGKPGGHHDKPRVKRAPPERPKAPPPPVARAVPSVRPAAAPMRADPTAAAPEGGVRLVDLRKEHCRWPLNDPLDYETFRFCGAANNGCGPYCGHHASLAYTRPQTRTEAQMAADLRKRMAAAKQWKERSSGRATAN